MRGHLGSRPPAVSPPPSQPSLPVPRAHLAELLQALAVSGLPRQCGQQLQELGARGGRDVQEGAERLAQRAGGQAALRHPAFGAGEPACGMGGGGHMGGMETDVGWGGDAVGLG